MRIALLVVNTITFLALIWWVRTEWLGMTVRGDWPIGLGVFVFASALLVANTAYVATTRKR